MPSSHIEAELPRESRTLLNTAAVEGLSKTELPSHEGMKSGVLLIHGGLNFTTQAMPFVLDSSMSISVL